MAEQLAEDTSPECPKGIHSIHIDAAHAGSNLMAANVLCDMGGCAPEDGARGHEENRQAAGQPHWTFLGEVPETRSEPRVE